MTTMYQLIEAVNDEIENGFEAQAENEDLVREIAAEHVPIMNYDLAIMLSDDLTLGFPEEMPPIDEPNAFQVIGWAIEERLRESGDQHLDQLKENAADDSAG